ncbi:MAG TPA: sigma-54 dependent transcriptional regulator [Bacteroidales bacterium]|nr:sigma-54 dependent transcriptional regulator [Bacteroidales bacterium]
MKQSGKILVCDDDEAIRGSLSFLLKKAGYETVSASQPESVIRNIRENDFGLVLLDMNFSLSINGEEGIDLLRKIKLLKPGVPVVLMTAWASVELAVRGIKHGASDFVIKPWNNIQLLKIIETAITLSAPLNSPSEAKSETGNKLPEFEGIVGNDPKLLEILDVIKRVAPTNAPVLITGESGTGKELIASAIHNFSLRRSAPFIKVNLGGVPSSLFESEMFGYKKGAFTDAKSDHPGRFEKAHNGTIFLDEIGDLPQPSQVKLLRALQDQTFERLGDSNSITVDVRILSATNHNLYSLVERGLFREDLLYRINLIQIEVPPLRSRKNDIPILSEYFKSQAATKYSLSEKTISAEGMDWLCEQSWPGNIRELKNIVERTVILTSGSIISQNDLVAAQGTGRNPDQVLSKDSNGKIDDMERSMIIKTIEECGGNISRSSEKLGISRATLYRKMQKYDIDTGQNE